MRVARGIAESCDDRVEVWLAGTATHGSEGCVSDIYTGICCLQHRSGVETAGVVRVKVYRDGDFLAKGANELKGSVRLAQAGHVFNCQEMRAEFFQLLGHADVILERILWPAFVENIAGVADRGLADGAGLEYGIDGHTHVLNGVKRIKDAKDIDALRVSFTHEFFDDVIGIRCITNRVRATQQHLETNVGNAATQLT